MTSLTSDIKAKYEQDGYAILPALLSSEQVAALRQALAPYLAEDVKGRNRFEGNRTNRIYSLPAKHPLFADLICHPLVMAVVEADLGPSALLSACLAINLHPGEDAQPWHYDDMHCQMPRPRTSLGVSVFWALDDTTEDNGATEVIPGSHKWGDQTPDDAVNEKSFEKKGIGAPLQKQSQSDAFVKAIMPAGSLMIAKGTLWHRGGANQSDKPRLIITPQYCPGWVRPLENIQLGMGRDAISQLPIRAQELLGYSIHPPFMGYVDGRHPAKLLNR